MPRMISASISHGRGSVWFLNMKPRSCYDICFWVLYRTKAQLQALQHEKLRIATAGVRREGGREMSESTPVEFDAETILAEVAEGRSLRTYPSRRIVFAQGAPADAVFYLQLGRIKVSLVSPRGKEAVVAILGSGEFFGEGCLAGQTVRMATAACVAPCTVMRIEKQAMIRLLHDRPAVADAFMAHLLTRNIRIEEDLTDQLFNSSEKRLARVLLLMANFGKEAVPEPVIARLSQQTLADMVGTTRSRVSFFMNKFRRLGLIEYDGDSHGGLHVNRSLLNVVLHD